MEWLPLMLFFFLMGGCEVVEGLWGGYSGDASGWSQLETAFLQAFWSVVG